MQQAIDFTKLLRGYKNKWVAVSSDKREIVGAAADSPKTALAEAKKRGCGDPTILWAAEDYSGFISKL